MLKRITLLALVAVSLACAKSYTILVSEPTQAGSAQLKPGEYTVKVDGMQVILKDSSGNRIDVAATVEPADQKFSYTAVVISRPDGKSRIEAVNLGGSKNKVVFQ